MIRYATMLVLFVCALGTWAHDPVAHQNAGAAADQIDGSKNPELIPDSLAFRLYFIALSENDSTLTESTERQKAFFATAGLKAADTEVAASILRAFKKRLDAMTETYNTAVLSTNDSTADRRLFAAKREDLVQATRNEFSMMLSVDGVKHLNGHVQREKEKIQASKSEIQQIAALRSKPTGFQLASMKSQFGGGCSGFMDLHYNAYTTFTTQGKNIYGSTRVDGYTGEGNGSWCYGQVTHQPRLWLKIVGTAGSWFYGQSVIPSSQISYGANIVVLCDLCTLPESFDAQDNVYCTSSASNIYLVVFKNFVEWATTWMISTGPGIHEPDTSGEITYLDPVKPWCKNGTPDFNPTQLYVYGPNAATDAYFNDQTLLWRFCPTCYWHTFSPGSTSGAVYSYPASDIPNPPYFACTHTGPQL